MPPEPPPDSIVVLGCRVRGDGGLPDAARRRVDRAAQAWLALGPVLVIASGGRVWDGKSEADAFSDGLVDLGVPRDRIVRELCSLSTLENAFYTSELLRAAGALRPGVVTCEWHTDRAVACFERAGVRAVPLPARAPGTGLVRAGRQFAEQTRARIDLAFGCWISR